MLAGLSFKKFILDIFVFISRPFYAHFNMAELQIEHIG